MLQAIDRPTGTTSRDQHGIEFASRLSEVDERAAMAWLHEHEALPWHKSTQCPMSESPMSETTGA